MKTKTIEQKKLIAKRLENPYATANAAFKLEDLDEGKRLVKGMLSTFGVIDSDGDILMRGAFSKSIMERGPKSSSNRRIAYLRMHNWNMQIGKFLELEETESGLMFVGPLGRSTAGEDALRDYQDGIIREHSIGFRYIDGKLDMVERPDGSVIFEVREVELFEGSAVTFGANEFTPTLGVSGATNDENSQLAMITRMQSRLEAIEKALRNGKGSDERLHSIEMEARQLRAFTQNFFLSLNNETATPGLEKSTLPGEKDFSADFWRSLTAK